MKIRLKGVNTYSKKVEQNKRGRSYDIGTVTGQVQLSENGLTILFTDEKLSKKLQDLLRDLNED